MVDRYDDDETSPFVTQRRWSAAAAAAKTLQGECEVLREVVDLAEHAWRNARARLAAMQVLCDALAEQLGDLEMPRESVSV